MLSASVFSQEFLNELDLHIRQIVNESTSGTAPESAPEKKYITKQDIRDLCHISLPTIDRYCDIGIFKRYKIGTRVLFLESEVLQAIAGLPVKFSHR
jgi:predicted DNA-binding transcriptional regulator AlpA